MLERALVPLNLILMVLIFTAIIDGVGQIVSEPSVLADVVAPSPAIVF